MVGKRIQYFMAGVPCKMYVCAEDNNKLYLCYRQGLTGIENATEEIYKTGKFEVIE